MRTTMRVFRAPSILRQSPTAIPRTRTPYIARPFSSVAPRQGDDKKSNLMDRDKMNTESNEYSKTGSDAKAAQEGSAAFDPNKTSPESQQGASSDEAPDSASQGNPLNVSPGNQEISQPREDTEGGTEQGKDRTATSGGGSPGKGKKVS